MSIYRNRDRRSVSGMMLMAAAVAAISCAACVGEAQADPAAADNDPTGSASASAAFCDQSLPSLQAAAYGEQSGHMEALKTLEACYQRLGQSDQANLVRWRIYQELNRSDPHDE